MRLPFGSYALAAFACCAFTAVRAQTTTDTVYHLHGSVLNGVTGRPIGRALVVSSDRRLATMTNSEGQFTLDVSVPPAAADTTSQTAGTVPMITMGFGPNAAAVRGRLLLSAQRPGFLPSRRGAAISLDASSSTQNIVLRLLPAASIQGQVIATGAEGLQGMRVELLRHAVQDGRMTWQVASSRAVGTDGSFHITNLQPGEYTAATIEWSPRMFNPVTAAPETQQYPPHFLGDTRTLDAATKLHLGYGQTARADLHLSAVPYYAVTIPVQGMPQNAGANVRVLAGTGFQLYQLGWNNREGAVEGALPDGDYTVIVSSQGPVRGSAQIPLHIAGAPVVHAPAGLTPTQDIPVNVRDERTQTGGNGSSNVSLTLNDGLSTSVKTPGFFIAVRPEDNAGGAGMMQTTSTGPVLQSMLPGRYFLQTNALGRGYIASLTCDGVNLLTQPLVVNESGHTAPVEVTLRDDGGTVDGTVDLGNSGIQAARVMVLPTDGSGHVLYGFTNTGTFQIGNVPPGSYRVFAVPEDQADTLPYNDPQAMRPYDARGGAVSVMAGQTAQVQAELLGIDDAAVKP